MWMPLATSSYGASKNGLTPMPVCGMKPIECTTPSSLLPSPITSVTRSARDARCSSFCTSSSSSGAGLGSRSMMRWISRNRSKPVSTTFGTGLLRDLGDVEADGRIGDDPRDENALTFENPCHIRS